MAASTVSSELAASIQEAQDEDDFYKNNELKHFTTKFKGFKVCFFTAGGRGSDGCLIYIGLSKAKNESISHLRMQLLTLHCFVISAGTRSIVKNFQTNSAYDFEFDPYLRRQI